MATAIEAGVADDLELETTNPWDPNTDIAGNNPIGKIPALVLPDGRVLFDSPVICEYLDSLNKGSPLYPSSKAARWLALTRMALADGLMDAAILRRRELMRSEGEQSPSWIERQVAVVKRSLDAMEAEAGSYSGVDIGLLTIAIASGYMDFRWPELDWRKNHSRLAAWYEEFSKRPSMRDTEPHE